VGTFLRHSVVPTRRDCQVSPYRGDTLHLWSEICFLLLQFSYTSATVIERTCRVVQKKPLKVYSTAT